MAQVIQKVKALLEQRFPNAEIELDSSPSGRITGSVTWSDFVGLPQLERQQKVWDVFRSNLNVSEQQKLSLFLTFTPEEVADMDAVLVA